MKSSLAAILAAQIALKCISASAVLEERDACKKDNLLNALVHRIPDSYQFCSAYISVPATTTVTVYTSTCILSSYFQVPTIIHPLYLFNLQPQPYSITPSPLSYNSPSPTPITIPGGAQGYVAPGARRVKRDSDLTDEIVSQLPTPPPVLPHELLRRATPTLPPYISATYPPSRISSACSCLSVPAAATETVSLGSFSIEITTTCTTYIPTTVATYPAFCAPSLQVNAPQPAAHASYAVVPSFTVPSKMDCCAACAAVFNCVWWKFTLAAANAGGWSPGKCHYAYFTGKKGDADMSEFGQAAVCPNGVTRGILNPDFSHIGDSSNNDKSGYNFGPCGGALNVFESNQDWGYPNDYSSHTCGGWNGEPTTNPPGCD